MDFSEIARILQVAVGIGLVIFVHEAGHFLAARWCGVRVEVFSLGFGPRLFGWRRGGTLYQIAAIPMGGYVRMAGEELDAGRREPAPDELGSKSVGQRFLIFSGGVLMNVVFALLVFPLLFWVGVPFQEPLLGPSVPGSPAWEARLEPGTRVLSVDGTEVYDWMHIPNEVALAGGDAVELVVRPPGAEDTQRIRVQPKYNELQGIYSIGVTSPFDPEWSVLVTPGSVAEQAGVRSGDRLVEVLGGVEGAPKWSRLRELMEVGAPLALVFGRGEERREVRLEPEVTTEGAPRILGIGALENLVEALRPNEDVAALGLREQDRIEELNGRPVYRAGDLLRALVANEGPERFVVERDGSRFELELPALPQPRAVAFAEDVALRSDREGNRVYVIPGSAADRAGMRSGDRLVELDGRTIESYDDILELARAVAKERRTAALRIERTVDGAGATQELEVAAAEIPMYLYGFNLQGAEYVYQARNPVEAISIGVASCWKLIEDTWLTLKGIAARSVSADNVGGIITIGVVAHHWASAGWTKLLFFLCVLSLNLAFINVLPVPLLDGGHLFFLLIEKLKGSPVSERIMGYSQLVGLVLILSIAVFVIYNDLQRFLFT